MAVSTYLSIINVNRLIAPIKRHRMTDGLKNLYAASRDLLQTLRHILTECERIEKDIPLKWKKRK